MRMDHYDDFILEDGQIVEDGFSELDSHADTTAAGSNMILLDHPDTIMNHVDVAPFSADYAPMKNIPIATCGTAWTNPETGICLLYTSDAADE